MVGCWPARGSTSAPLAGALVALGVMTCAGCGDDQLLESRLRPHEYSSQEGCVPAGAPCQVSFAYPLEYPTPSSVELRGDFQPDGWNVGVPLQVDGTQWYTEIHAAAGSVIRYQFLLGGTEWVSDPNNPITEPDGDAGLISVLSVACYQYICP